MKRFATISIETQTVLAFITLIVLIGFNVVAIRLGNRELEPFWGAGARFSIAALMFAALMVWSRAPKPAGAALVGALLYGGLGIAAYFAFVYWGLVDVGAGYGAVLLALTPLITLLLATAQGMEPFRWRGTAGAIIAAGGIALIFGDQLRADVPILAVAALVIAAACAAEAGLVMRRFTPTSLVSTNVISMTVGASSLLVLSVLSSEPRSLPESAEVWAAFVYLTTAGTVGVFMLALFVLRHWTASKSSYQFVLAPIAGITLAAIVLDEPLRLVFFAGTVLVVAGVFVGVVQNRRRDASDNGWVIVWHLGLRADCLDDVRPRSKDAGGPARAPTWVASLLHLMR